MEGDAGSGRLTPPEDEGASITDDEVGSEGSEDDDALPEASDPIASTDADAAPGQRSRLYSRGWVIGVAATLLVLALVLAGVGVLARLADDDIAQGIEDREKEMGLWNIRDRIIRLAGPDCFSKKADYVHGGQKPSTADTFASHGIYLRKGDANRSQKIRQFQARLRVPGDREGGGRPMLQVYRSCKRFIEIIPLLQSDPNNPEDVDQNGPDHIYDEACHLCMFRPMRTGVRVGGGGVPAGGSAGFFNPDAGARTA